MIALAPQGTPTLLTDDDIAPGLQGRMRWAPYTLRWDSGAAPRLIDLPGADVPITITEVARSDEGLVEQLIVRREDTGESVHVRRIERLLVAMALRPGDGPDLLDERGLRLASDAQAQRRLRATVRVHGWRLDEGIRGPA